MLNIREVPKFHSRKEFMSKPECWEIHPVLQLLLPALVAVTQALVPHPEREAAAQKLAEVGETIVQLCAVSLELSSKGSLEV